MDKNLIRESILKAVTKEIDGWLEEEPGLRDPIEYEHRLLSRAMRIGKVMLEQSQGEVSVDRNKKKRFNDVR